ncbi:MAG: hypothetical protein V4672_18430 [Verrucomicrobiota bacterium]
MNTHTAFNLSLVAALVYSSSLGVQGFSVCSLAVGLICWLQIKKAALAKGAWRVVPLYGAVLLAAFSAVPGFSHGDLIAKPTPGTQTSSLDENGYATASWTGDLVFKAVEAGAAGNDIVVVIRNTGAPYASMNTQRIDDSLVIDVATDENGNQTSTIEDVCNRIQAVLILVTVSGDDFYSSSLAPTGNYYLSGGFDP